MSRPHAALIALLAAVVWLSSSGCRGVSVDYDEVDAVVERRMGRDVDADATPIESELRELSSQLLVEQREEGTPPRHLAVLLNVGEDALVARLHLIRSARETVDLQVYVWADDLAGGLVFYELLLAARRGVHVRLLIDQMANRSRGYSALIAIAHENIEVQSYNPVREHAQNEALDLASDAFWRFTGVNERMHNKVMVVDGELAIVGGRNIEDHYFDLDPEFSYLDRDLLLAGPEVRDVARSFQEYWDHEITVWMSRIPSVGLDLLRFGSEEWQPPDWRAGLVQGEWLRERAGRRDIAEVLPHSRLREVGRVEFEADPPKKDGLHDWNTWRREISISEAALLDARERVLIQSNYLIFRHAIMNELPKLFERGLEILYSTNSMASTANLLTYSASRKQRLDLVHMGFDVRELRPLPADIEHFLPRFEELAQRDEAGNLVSAPQIAIHAKSIVIDDDVAIVGSHNFDPRSALYNTEALFVVWDEPLTAELKREIELASGDGNSWICHHVDYVPVWSEANEVFAAVSRALPILDIWPWRGYSMYQLREGHESVGVHDPEFFEHYEKMGEMPEVDSTSKMVKTRFLSSIIAPFWNLL